MATHHKNLRIHSNAEIRQNDLDQPRGIKPVKALVTTLSLLCLILILSSTTQAANTQCNDTLDNDNDGKIDALVSLNPENGQQRKWVKNPLEIRTFVNAKAEKWGFKKLPAIAALHLDQVNAKFVCKIAGYRDVAYTACSSPYGSGCGYHTPENNWMAKWNAAEGKFNLYRATKYTNGWKWLASLTCTNRLPRCSDGIDNDGDGATDYPSDLGCASANDNAEAPHDPGCDNLNDNEERDDTDNDGIFDDEDNCPLIPNTGQADNDNDGLGNVCDNDDDNDGILDNVDNCRFVPNAGQADTDNDGIGNACDNDDDNDTIRDNVDNCRLVPNTNQADNDNDGIGDVCDNDDDNDTILDNADNCQFIANTGQADNDNDGLGNPCDNDDDNDTIRDNVDNCRLVPNTNQADNDNDGLGDVCDNDDDNDTILDNVDNCQFVYNAGQADTDNDGIGNACDNDDDNDTILDNVDNCRLIPNTNQADNDNDGIGDVCDNDDDNDTILDNADNCQFIANTGQADNDNDGLGNPCDNDDDNDTIRDNVDNCRLIPNTDQADNDNDGLGDACDNDDDNDTIRDNDDNCPLVPNTNQADNDNDGIGDVCDNDDDNDQIPDNDDNCPLVSNPDQTDTDKDGLGDACDDEQDVAPLAPKNLSASDGSSEDNIKITWDAANLADTYQVYRSEFEGEQGAPLGDPTTDTEFIDQSAVPGVVYYYSVTATNEHGTSEHSNTDSGYRFNPDGECDSDGDGVCDDQEEVDGTDPDDRGSFQLHLKSPAFTKYNTFLKQWNFLELIASGTKKITAKVTVHLLDGSQLAVKTVVIDPQTQVDVDVNSMIASACEFSNQCAGYADLDQSGIIDTYGVVRIDFNDKEAGETLSGRMSSYRKDSDGSFSFAFAKELRNPTRGTTHATGNTYDPQATGYLVPNWLEIINLNGKVHSFTYNLFNQEGVKVLSKVVSVPPLGEVDLQAGHEITDALGKVVESVYLAEIVPHDGAAEYFATVSRYSSNAPAGVEPESYHFAFALDGRAGTGDTQYMTISNEAGACYSQTNWVEVVNVREKPVTAMLVFRGPQGSVLHANAVNYTLEPKAQYHFNASALLAKGDVGAIELRSSDRGALISQSLVYYHDCEENKVQTAYASQGRIVGRDVQAGSINTFLEMINELRLVAAVAEKTIVTTELRSFNGKDNVVTAQLELNNYGTSSLNTSDSSALSIDSNSYGALTLRTDKPGKLMAEVLRIREKSAGRIDFAMPTAVQ